MMLKKSFVSFGVVLVVAALPMVFWQGCAEAPRQFSAAQLTPETGETLPIPETRVERGGKALIVVYRTFQMHGDECPIDIFLDGSHRGDVAVRKYLTLSGEPGDHVIMMRVSAGECDIRRNSKAAAVEANKVYCFRTGIDLKGGLERVPESVAAKELVGCKLSASRSAK